MKRTVSNVVIIVYAFPTIKMTAFDATVSTASQENLAVGIYSLFSHGKSLHNHIKR